MHKCMYLSTLNKTLVDLAVNPHVGNRITNMQMMTYCKQIIYQFSFFFNIVCLVLNKILDYDY